MPDVEGIVVPLAERPLRASLFVRSCCVLLLLSLSITPGCGGCSSSAPKTPEQLAEEAKQRKEEELKKKQAEKKPDFVFGRPTLQPGTRGLPSLFIKPGHWVSAVQSAKANHFDFLGEMDAAIVDLQGAPIDLDRTPFRISTARPAALVKGQEKYLDMTVFVPHGMRRARLSNTLRGSYAGSNVNREETMFQALPPYQYVLLVVARVPERYGYLNQKRPSIVSPWSDHSRFKEDIQQYLVVSTSSLRKPLLLPGDLFTWTSTAYMFWDDVDPGALLPEQQQALVDWLHWGGQLIVSGPGSLSSLKGSFLAPYLPAEAGDARKFSKDDLRELNDAWTMSAQGKSAYPLRMAAPWSGVELKLHEQAQFIPNTGNLLAERRIGLGRVAISAMHLSQPELTQWPSFDVFFNACVLRRGPRKWELGLETPRLAWAEGDRRPDDPARVSGVRFFSRDSGSKLNYHVLKSSSEIVARDWSPHSFGIVPQMADDLPEDDEEITTDTIAMGGVASWNPFSPASDAARETLREAAGVRIPEPWFVLWVVGLYILVIVPVNWLVFYVLGRLEWAWIAAPLLAVGFSVLVVRLAQLDIGFVRAQTEVAVLELQPGYERGHLTRYVALYTSLGTQYNMEFETTSAVAQPLPLNAEFQLRPGQSFSTVHYRRFEEVTLNDVSVSSNSTGMLQGEQMVRIKPISLERAASGQWRVRNASEYDLAEVCVSRNLDHQAQYHSGASAREHVEAAPGETSETELTSAASARRRAARRPSDETRSNAPRRQPAIEFAWVGELKAGAAQEIHFEKLTATGELAERREKRTPSGAAETLKLRRLFAIAESPSTLAPGETRLVGKIDAPLPGARVTPVASQSRGATMVVAHLHYEHLPPPRRDLNTAGDVARVIEETHVPSDEVLSPAP